MILLPFDTETTSNVPATTRVVQVAAVAVSVDDPLVVTPVINTLCNPGVDISDGAREVHGITNEMVADAPSDEEAILELAKYIDERRGEIILCGHNCTTFDIPILERISGMSFKDVPVIDSLVGVIRVFPDAPSHKLGEIVQHLGLDTGDKAHDAMADLLMVLKIVNHLSDGLQMSWSQMAEWCATPRILKRCHFGKHKGALWGKGPGCVPVGYVRFICERFEDVLPDMIVTIRHHYGMGFKYIRERERAALEASFM